MLLLSGSQQESSSFFLARPLKLSFILYIIAYSKSIVVMSKKPFFCTFIILIASLSAMFSNVRFVRIIIICLLFQTNQAKMVIRKIHRSRCHSGKNIAAQPKTNKSAIDQKPIRRRKRFTRGSYAIDLSLGHLASFIQALRTGAGTGIPEVECSVSAVAPLQRRSKQTSRPDRISVQPVNF